MPLIKTETNVKIILWGMVAFIVLNWLGNNGGAIVMKEFMPPAANGQQQNQVSNDFIQQLKDHASQTTTLTGGMR